jgi:uncharacterized membrane protein YoaK (UPF0700 family)
VLSKPIPAWILACAFSLAWTAGATNAVGFLGVDHQALSHMSGQVTIVGNELALARPTRALAALLVVASYLAGCTLSAMIIRQGLLRLGRRYGVVLVLESAFLFCAWGLLRAGRDSGVFLAAMACGLQNAMVSSFSGAVIRTTHVTGIITDLGIALGQFLRRQPIDGRRAGLYLVLLAGFFLGAACGSYGYVRLGFAMLVIPAALTGLGGAAYMLAVSRNRHQA